MRFITLNSPSSGIGASTPSASLSPRKTFVVSGDYEGDVIVEGTHDGTSWFIVFQSSPPSGQPKFIPVNVVASQLRVRRTGAGGSLNVFVGAETVSTQSFSAITVSQITPGAGIDVSSFPSTKTLAVGNNFTGEVVFEGSQDGNNWNVITQLQAGSQETFNNLSYSQIRARTTTTVTGTPRASVGASNQFAVTPTGTADWDTSLIRFFFVDNDNGDDGNVGYIDAAPGTTFTSAESAAVAIKTLEQLREILPRVGASRSAVVLMKVRSDAGNYLDKSGTQDYLDVGYGGYIYLSFRGSTDLSNDVDDYSFLGGVVAAAGPNADQSFTVDSISGGNQPVITVAAGALPATSDELAGLKVQWAGNVTAGLRDEGNMALYRVDATNFALSFDSGTVPVNGDEFFLVRPGVKVTDIRGNGFLPAATAFSGTPTDAAILAGIETTSSFTSRGLGRLKFAFFRTAGTTTFENAGGVEATGNFVKDDGSLQVNGASIDARGSFTVRRTNYTQIQQSAFHGATTRFQSLPTYNIGEGCYSNSAPLFRTCGPFGIRPGVTFNTDHAIGSLNASGKPGFRLPAGIQIESSSADIGGLDFDSGSGALEVIGTCAINAKDLRGTTTNNYVVDLTDSYASTIILLTPGSASGAVADMVLAGTVPASFDDLATTNVVDENGNDVQGTAGHIVSECVLVDNASGTALAAGDVVKGTGTANEVTEAQAAIDAESAHVQGVMVTSPANGSNGYMAAGPVVVANFDGAPTVDAIAYLSPGTTAELTTTVPAVAGTNQKLRAGRVLDVVSGTLARVMWHPENLAVAADGNP